MNSLGKCRVLLVWANDVWANPMTFGQMTLSITVWANDVWADDDCANDVW